VSEWGGVLGVYRMKDNLRMQLASAETCKHRRSSGGPNHSDSTRNIGHIDNEINTPLFSYSDLHLFCFFFILSSSAPVLHFIMFVGRHSSRLSS
jgi:hypothetical protein